MLSRFIHAHEPALTPQEAAMLPAMAAIVAAPGNLLIPRQDLNFRAVETAENSGAESAGYAPSLQTGDRPRRGSAAGRAVLRAAGISMPGPGGMRSGCRTPQSAAMAAAAREQLRYL